MLELRRRARGAVRPEDEKSAQIGVIDIGSNSVRLIIYRREGRAFWPILNEKLLAGLGRGVAQTGRLSPEGSEMALQTLRRFQMIAQAREVFELHAFATAAVREAADGADFVARIKRECGVPVRILSGEEEGRLSALGVLAGGAHEGLVGDLGGSSLELCPIRAGAPQQGVTLPLGPLAVLGERDADMKALRATINGALESVDGVFGKDLKDFYAVGGAWRNLARVDMSLRNYPLHVLHHYEMSRAQAKRTAAFVASQSAESLGELQGVTSRRVALLPYAALLLECILEQAKFERVVISAYGVREGALFDRMPPEIQSREPLLAGCAAYGRRLAPNSNIGPSLGEWVDPVFADEILPREALLRRAAALLADIGSVMHPDHRAELAADQVLYSPIAGMTHLERAFLATALFHRYRGPGEPAEPFPAYHMAPPEALERARALGLALRLGCAISGRTPGLLALTRIAAEGKALVLAVEKAGAPLVTDQAEKRLKQLAAALGLEPKVAAGGAG